MREYLTSWRRVRQVAGEFIENGDRVFVAVRHVSTGKQSGIETEEQIFAVWTFRDGKVIRVEYFEEKHRDAALAAAGLDE